MGNRIWTPPGPLNPWAGWVFRIGTSARIPWKWQVEICVFLEFGSADLSWRLRTYKEFLIEPSKLSFFPFSSDQWEPKILLPPMVEVFPWRPLLFTLDFNSFLRSFCNCITAPTIWSLWPSLSPAASGIVQGLKSRPWQPLVVNLPWKWRKRAYMK